MKVSLVLATLERVDEIRRLIDSLVAQTDREFELIVVDQNRDDRLVPVIEQGLGAGLSIRRVRMAKAGLSAARNEGLKVLRHEIVGFPDDDCWYDSDVIERVRRRFMSGDGIDGVVARWQEQDGLTAAPAAYQLSYRAWRVFRGGHASSITLFFSRSLLERVGGFDERLGLGSWYGAGEETDIVLRALRDRSKLQYCPDTVVHHRYSRQDAERLPEICAKARRRARGTGAIYCKHGLPKYVVLRGLVAPVALPLCRLSPLRVVVIGFFTVIGRIEGYVRWRLREIASCESSSGCTARCNSRQA